MFPYRCDQRFVFMGQFPEPVHKKRKLNKIRRNFNDRIAGSNQRTSLFGGMSKFSERSPHSPNGTRSHQLLWSVRKGVRGWSDRRVAIWQQPVPRGQ